MARKITQTDDALGFATDEVEVITLDGDVTTVGDTFSDEEPTTNGTEATGTLAKVSKKAKQVTEEDERIQALRDKGKDDAEKLVKDAKEKAAKVKKEAADKSKLLRELGKARKAGDIQLNKVARLLPKLEGEAYAGIVGDLTVQSDAVRQANKGEDKAAIETATKGLVEVLADVPDAIKKVKDAAKAERDAAKARAVGETGDAEQDALFHAAVDKATALAIVPPDPSALGLSFLTREGVKLTSNGLVLPDNLTREEWVDATSALQGVGDVAKFALGDALIFGEARYGKQYDVLTKALHLEKSTVKNYKYVAGTFPISERVEGASFTHHLEAAGLYAQNPAAARNILQEAVTKGYPTIWVRNQVNSLKVGPITKAEAKLETRNALVLATDEQYEQDIAQLRSPAAIQKHNLAETVALIELAEEEETVPSGSAVRIIARLQRQLDEARGEAQVWKDKYEEAYALLDAQAQAQLRVVAAVHAPEDEDELLEEDELLDEDALGSLYDEDEDEGDED